MSEEKPRKRVTFADDDCLTTTRLIPLAKKTAREQQQRDKVGEPHQQQPPVKSRREQDHMEGVSERQYRRICNGVSYALCDIVDSDPVVLDVATDEPSYSYYLAYYPANKERALRLLQTLYVSNNQEPELHSKLVLALCHPDFLEESDPEVRKADDVLLMGHCGATRDELGRFERTYDIEDLGALLYIQKCRVLGNIL